MIPNTRFIELRKRLGPSQTDFAANLGVARSTIADIERGRIKVSKRVKNKIVEKFRDEAGYFDTEKIDISVELKQGVETGVKQGFDDFTMPEDQREIFKKHTEVKKLLWGVSLWTSGYYANTVGKYGSEEAVIKYITGQGNDYKSIYSNQLKLFE